MLRVGQMLLHGVLQAFVHNTTLLVGCWDTRPLLGKRVLEQARAEAVRAGAACAGAVVAPGRYTQGFASHSPIGREVAAAGRGAGVGEGASEGVARVEDWG